MVFSNLMLICVSYSVNNLHLVAVVLQEASHNKGQVLSLKCVVFQYVRWRMSEKCESLNVIHHYENPIEWHGCSASPLLSKLGSIPFWKLKLPPKGRRCDDIRTIQEQSPVICIAFSGEDGRHLLGTEH